MPLFESESIILRSYNLSEADRIVVFFSREHGIVRGVAKGSRRLKSRFGSSLEPFSSVNISFFQKEDRELVSLQSADLLRSRFNFSSDPDYLSTFSYLAELLIALVPPHDPHEHVYRMVAACLDLDLDDPNRLQAVRLYFEMWLLRLGGYMPDWERCSACYRGFKPNEPASLKPDNHLICNTCRGARSMTPVGPTHLELFTMATRLSPFDFVDRAADLGPAVIELSVAMRRIISVVVGNDLFESRAFTARS